MRQAAKLQVFVSCLLLLAYTFSGLETAAFGAIYFVLMAILFELAALNERKQS